MTMRTSTLRKDTIVSKTEVYWWIVITCLTILDKTGKCTTTCPTVQQTSRRVQRCPMNENEWESAAIYKKCGELHRNCTLPTRFEYHCALNMFLNETWEVCAPGRYLLGYCMEYNELGNRIQDDYRRNCLAMDPPCPSRYNSTEAYRYPKCYQIVNSSPDIYIYKTTPSSTHTTMVSNTDKKGETKEETYNGNIIWIAVPSSCIGVFVVISIPVILCMVRRRYSMMKKRKKKIVELHPLNPNHLN